MDPAQFAAWQRSPAAQWVAIGLSVAPLYILAFLNGLQQQLAHQMQIPDWRQALLLCVLQIAVFGGLMTAALYILCGQRLRDLQLQPGTLAGDAGLGLIGLCLVLALMFGLALVVGALTLVPGFHIESMPQENLQLGAAMAHDPRLRWIMLGPVAWLQAGGIEEYSRVFVLSRLWRVYPAPRQQHIALLGMSAAFGCAHLWEGWFAMLGTALIGYLLGRLYMERGRVLPLMLAHAAYDMLVMLALIGISSLHLPVK
jgi:membrane protease YdiL (CAAX protease family)